MRASQSKAVIRVAPNSFRIGIPSAFLDPEGGLAQAAPTVRLVEEAAGVAHGFYEGQLRTPLAAEQIRDFDGIVVPGYQITEAAFRGAERLTVIGLFGVGFDYVDLEACTGTGVAVFNTPDGVRRPMAQASLALLLALSTKLAEKDRRLRAGEWPTGNDSVGVGLADRTLGLIGAGNIGGDFLRVTRPFGLRYLAHDPFAEGALTESLGVRYVDLPTLLAESDFVSIHCPLNEQTRHLVGAAELRRMKPTAYLINTARGALVDQAALTEALRAGTIAGAGLDVLDPEPISPDDPILKLDNVIVAPHNLGHTDELVVGCSSHALAGIIQVAHGEPPPNLINREVLETERFGAKLRGHRERWEGQAGG
jgi:phosphoglycerate dehydrogenase-like enzyme